MAQIESQATGDRACNDNNFIPEYKVPIETCLIKYLRQWCGDPAAVLDDGETVERKIASLVGFFISECLQCVPSNRVGEWSDGVNLLQIQRTTDTSFKLLGVSWIGIGQPNRAPFEIDLILEPGVEAWFSRCQFRIGMIDEHGNAAFCTRRHVTDVALLESRPRRNQDWAMAVELTPLPSTDADNQFLVSGFE